MSSGSVSPLNQTSKNLAGAQAGGGTIILWGRTPVHRSWAWERPPLKNCCLQRGPNLVESGRGRGFLWFVGADKALPPLTLYQKSNRCQGSSTPLHTTQGRLHLPYMHQVFLMLPQKSAIVFQCNSGCSPTTFGCFNSPGITSCAGVWRPAHSCVLA